MTLRAAAARAAEALSSAGVPEAEFEAEYLTRESAGVTRAAFFAGAEAPESLLRRLEDVVNRRMAREPSAYITGNREFYGRSFAVGRGVLVPRPETEMLVEIGVAALGRDSDAIVVDIGTGSGAVAISVAAEVPGAKVIGLDISATAMAFADQNARVHAPHLELVIGDLATPLGRADVVLANLPYIPADDIDALEPEVSKWEPRVALDGGSDGLNVIRSLIADCGQRLHPRLLALEVGYGQAEAVELLLEAAGARVETLKDLSGIDRVVCGRWD
jgi:release factor glutamine methyltransferase